MDKSDNLGNRMKGYEAVSKNKLTNRTPVIIRLDGKAFHTWTKKLPANTSQVDPFNLDMHEMMVYAASHIMQNMQNVEIAYTQSDEISILMNDWKKLTTDQWYGNNIQKMVSVTASAASAAFNFVAQRKGYITCAQDLALFDSRTFNLPKEEVNNYFIWRQQDATRNSINMLGQHYFSHNQLHGKNVSEVQDMLMLSNTARGPLNVNWNDLDVWKKRGTCIGKEPTGVNSTSPQAVDYDIPIFSRDRNYIESHLTTEDIE